MAEFHQVYQRAVYYDIVFKRDVSHEIDFVMHIYDQYVGHKPKSLLDLACGPGYHAREFAGRGLHAVGLDIREEMLAFAAAEAAQEAVEVTWIAADMRHLQLDTPVDVAINVFDGIDCLLSNDDLVAHFQAIAHNLHDNGLYFIDVTHPRLISFSHYPAFQYSGQRGDVAVTIHWRGNPDHIDLVKGVAHTEVEMVVRDGNHTHTFHDVAQERFLNAQEIALLARCSGVLEPIAWYGEYDLNQPLTTAPAATRMIAVLQKC